uniref:Vesicle transport protein n=1 Tax=Alexandrium monilatum TaxID=311494 RepID=A0A7S4UMD7_9DINO|mmetsp:Transcript_7616/g.24063  ORF Transcript_7616/g.24063 Transcript_7616/m.24063 type:complete len:139 (-) Transcript_7616:190-606(-)
MLDDNKKIGIGLCGIGMVCIVFGVCLFFERTFLALGNVSFLMGLGLLLGPLQVFKFFFRREKWKGTTSYFVGISLIILRWSFCGFVLQMYGVWKLFAAFLPNVLTSLKMAVPGASMVLNMWPLSTVCGYIYDQRRLPC